LTPLACFCTEYYGVFLLNAQAPALRALARPVNAGYNPRMNTIDLRSDTVTWPTPEMRQAMADAPVGDDVYGDDPTVNELETSSARLVGKEAALFVPSGTFGNQLALFTWCPHGSEIILGEDCHIIQHEAGGAAAIAGVQTRTIPAPSGLLDPAAVQARVRTDDIHHPVTSLICIENAHSSGRVVPLAAMDVLQSVARKNSLPVHLDGARLFNAATALGVSAAQVAARADSVMFCLSKGLCAPVGSMLAGPKSFVDTARRKRKIMGGGMRQAGILAAAGLLALREMTLRLGEDHANATFMAKELAKIPGVSLEASTVEINMVFFRMAGVAKKPELGLLIVSGLAKQGILINPPSDGVFRFVTHYWIDRERSARVVAAFAQVVSSLPA